MTKFDAVATIHIQVEAEDEDEAKEKLQSTRNWDDWDYIQGPSVSPVKRKGMRFNA